jgi:hypothetical protein
MRENEPVLFVLSVCDGEIILEKGEILSEKRHTDFSWYFRILLLNLTATKQAHNTSSPAIPPASFLLP